MNSPRANVSHDHSASEGSKAGNLAVFVHVFKGAGTSVQAQISLKLGKASVLRLNDGIEDGQKFSDRVRTGLQEGPRAVLCGHFTVFRVAPILRKLGFEGSKYFSFIRQPMERLISGYHFHRSTPGSSLHALAKSVGLEDYFTTLLATDAKKILNHQCKVLSRDGTASFEAAREMIESDFAFVGTVEDITATNQQAQDLIGVTFSSSFLRNVSNKVATAADLSSGLHDRLLELTEGDRKLHEFVSNRNLRLA